MAQKACYVIELPGLGDFAILETVYVGATDIGFLSRRRGALELAQCVPSQVTCKARIESTLPPGFTYNSPKSIGETVHITTSTEKEPTMTEHLASFTAGSALDFAVSNPISSSASFPLLSSLSHASGITQTFELLEINTQRGEVFYNTLPTWFKRAQNL